MIFLGKDGTPSPRPRLGCLGVFEAQLCQKLSQRCALGHWLGEQQWTPTFWNQIVLDSNLHWFSLFFIAFNYCSFINSESMQFFNMFDVFESYKMSAPSPSCLKPSWAWSSWKTASKWQLVDGKVFCLCPWDPWPGKSVDHHRGADERCAIYIPWVRSDEFAFD